MSATPNPNDRPLLRLFNPDLASETWTLQRAFDEFREPELQSKSKGTQTDAKRYVRQWAEFELALATEQKDGQRIMHPLLLSDIGSPHLKAFQHWLVSKKLSNSQVNKAVGEIKAIIDLGAEEGLQVQTVKSRRMQTSSRPRFYLDDAIVEKLWTAAEKMTWPPRQVDRVKKGAAFSGTGIDPADWWRAILILLRTYGMRVQDLVAYQHGKAPIAWSTDTSCVSFDAQSPNEESLERWEPGWLFYTASKTGRQYFLPLMPHARAAVMRLHAAAISRLGSIDVKEPILPCPKSHGLTEGWKELQQLAEVSTRRGTPFQLEDFRKTVATYTQTIDSELPYAVCGWGTGSIKTRHYQQPEPFLIAKLPQAPMPKIFDAWL